MTPERPGGGVQAQVAGAGAEPQEAGSTFTVVGVGASAGGLKALQQFFAEVPADSGMVYVVIVHLNPDRESQIAQLLQNRAVIPIVQVSGTVKVEPDHAYIIPPAKLLSMVDGTVRLSDRSEHGQHAPIDHFFTTLADVHGHSAVGVVLSGTGSDGASGLRRIKEAGGITIAQAPDDADYDAMPRNAIATGQVDLVLPAGAIPVELMRLQRVGPRLPPPEHTATSRSDDESLLRQIFGRLRGTTGHDFSGYKRSTLLRRLDRRMRFNHVDTLEGYLALMRDDPVETRKLFQDLLISVSSFFRDPDAFEALRQEVIPRLFDEKGPDEHVRIWVAGCATGEEVYSIAILLLEYAAASGAAPNIQIFATDIDEKACVFAREAAYPETIEANVSAERLSRFFERTTDGYRAAKSLRELVLFATHDLLKDPPFSRLDLIACRNVLIYLGPDAKQHILQSFHYGLRPNGFLFLGSSETADGTNLFDAIDARHRIYSRVSGPHPVPKLPAPGPRHRDDDAPVQHAAAMKDDFSYGALHLHMLEAYAPPSLIVDERNEVVHLSERAGRYLRIGGGEPSRDLFDLVPSDLGHELRTALYRAFHHGEPTQGRVRVEVGDTGRPVNVRVIPREVDGQRRFALVVFEEVPAPETDADIPVAQGRHDTVERVEEELRRTREELGSTIRARDVTIEELQTANEELRSINEEHRATTEELETSQEELQSINEELTTVNQEHRGTIEELKQTNADLRNLMEAPEIATLFLDQRLQVRRYTPSMTKLVNLAAADVGRPLGHLTHRLQYGDLVKDAEDVMASLQSLEREVGTDSGEWYNVRLRPYRSTDDRIEGVVLTFYDITIQKHLEEREREARLHSDVERARLAALMEQMPAAVLVAEAPTGRVISYNGRARDIWQSALPQAASAEAYGMSFRGFHPDGTPYDAEEWPLARAVGRGEVVLDEEIEFEFADGRRRELLVSAAPVRGPEGSVDACVVTMVDISERKRVEDELLDAKREAEEANRAKAIFLATLSHEFRTPLNGMLGYADLLLFEGHLDAAQTRKVERIIEGVHHLSRMIDEILAFAKIDAGTVSIERRRVDARDIVREAGEMVEPGMTRKGLEFVIGLPEDAAMIETDPGKARQILVNLLGNALKYTERGSVRMDLRAEDDRIIVEVRDTGVGIAPENRERIFDRFWQVETDLTRRVEGTGIGLAAAREFSRLLGGDVEVSSVLGRGTVFTLWLPRARPSPASAR